MPNHGMGQDGLFTDTHIDARPGIESDTFPVATSSNAPDSLSVAFQLELKSRVDELKTLIDTALYTGPNPQSSIAPMLGQAEQAIVTNGAISSIKRTTSDPCVEATLHLRASGDTYYIGKTAWTGIHHDKTVLFGAPALRESWTAFKELAKDYATWSGPTLLHSIAAVPMPEDLRAAMLEMIPEPCDCDLLFDRFLCTFNATHPILDQTQMRLEVEEFRKAQSGKTTTWLAMYVGILALGLEIPITPLPPGRSKALNRVKGKQMMQSVQRLVFNSPATSKRPDLNTFQIMLVLLASTTLDVWPADGNDAKHGLLALTSRMAFTLGLHRDPQNTNLVSARDAELRRMLWLTYKFLDLEHAMQSGMPFLLRDSDSDVSDPDSLYYPWPAYQRVLVRAIPLWARVLHMSHSSNAQTSVQAFAELSGQLLELTLPTATPHRVQSSQANISMAAQRAVFYSSHSRMVFMLHAMSRGKCSETLVDKILLDSALMVLSQQIELDHVIEQNTDQLSAEAWRHFVVSLLYCSSWHATDYILAVLQDGRGNDALLTIMESSRSLMNKTTPFSASIIKAEMMYSALAAKVKETLRLRKEQDLACRVTSFEQSENSDLTMKVALDECLARAKDSISLIKDSEDPPPALYKYSKQYQSQEAGPDLVSWDTNDWANDMTLLSGFDVEIDWPTFWD